MSLHTRVVEDVQWIPVHAATTHLDDDGRLVFADGPRLDWHLLRLTDPKLKRGRVKITIVAKPADSCDTNLFLVRLGGVSVCSISRSGEVDINTDAEEIDISHQPDGFMTISIVFESHHATISLGTGKPEGWYQGSGREQYIFRAIEVELLTRNRTRQAIVDRLWVGQDPFKVLSAQLPARDLQGWNSRHAYLAEAIAEVKPEIVVEIGVWKGASTIFMANELKKMKLSAAVIAVDTFLGSSEHWFSNVTANLSFPNGFPSLFQTFLSNVKQENVEDYVVPFPMDSLNAAEVVRSMKLRPDMIHLDGGHDALSVSADLHAWWSNLAPGGMLIGDDYFNDGTWPMVKRAFDQFFGDRNLLPIEFDAGKCRIRKPR